MKKFYASIGIGVLALSLAACNDSATPKEGTKDTSNISMEDVYNKALERQDELKSASANVDSVQNMELAFGEEKMTLTSSTNMAMDMVVNPLAMHIKGAMTMANPMATEGDEENIEVPMEMYLSEEGFFVNDPSTDGWSKLPKELSDSIVKQTTESANAKQQLEDLKQFTKDFTFEQNDKEFILTLDADGEKFSTFLKEQSAKNLPQELQGSMDDLDAMKFNKAKYVMHIDKETYDMKEMTVDLSMTMDVEGSTSNIDSTSHITYTDINSIDSIKIPQEILDNAVEAQLPQQ